MLCATVSAVPLHWIGSVILCTRSTIGVFTGFWGFFFILLGYGCFCFSFSMYLVHWDLGVQPFLLFSISDAYNSYIYRSLYAHWDEASPESHNAYVSSVFHF